MAHLIDKDALVAEIERRLDELYKFLPDASKVENGTITISEACNTGKYTALESFKDYIDTLEVIEVGVDLGDPKGDKSAKYIIDTKTLEVKEVGLDSQIKDYINSHFTEGCDGEMISDWYKFLGGVHYKDLVEIAKHFYELGLSVSNKAQKGDKV